MEDDMPASAKNAKKVAFISSVFIFVLILIGIVWYFLQPLLMSTTIEEISPTPAPVSLTPTQPSTIRTKPTSTILANSAEIYSSEALGVRFHFLSNPVIGDESIKVLEQGNRIYIYPSSLPATQGQFIEKFNKSSVESLENAIRTQILKDKDPSRCFVTTREENNLIKAEITFPLSNPDVNDTFFEDSEYCSKDYAQTNGLRYFMYEETHPSKFYFISIGQYPIIADNDQPWQETVEIIN